MNRIPLVGVQKSLYQLLKTHQTTEVYDDLPEEYQLPCITFGGFTCKTNGAKGSDVSDTSIQLQIWSEYEGKKEVNTIADDIALVLSRTKPDLSEYGFKCLSHQIDFFESFPEQDDGYRGIITVILKIQNLEGSVE